MIYITHTFCEYSNEHSISRVFESEYEDLESDYMDFLLDKAKEKGVVINSHWGNIMNHEDHHPKLSKKEYKAKEKDWNKFLSKNKFENFLSEHEFVWESKYKISWK